MSLATVTHIHPNLKPCYLCKYSTNPFALVCHRPFPVIATALARKPNGFCKPSGLYFTPAPEVEESSCK